MDNQKKKFGLIGFPLGHSYSKTHFSLKFEREGLSGLTYENFEISNIDLLPDIIAENSILVGLNVTIPYKKAVLSYLDFVDPVARDIGAVNTLKISRSGNHCKISGYNTDVVGFSKSLLYWPLDANTKALIFGTGGSSLAIKYVLKQLGIGYLSVSRNGKHGNISYESIDEKMAGEYRLWVNCTPIGMFPLIDQLLPLPYKFLTPSHYLFDLVYNPEISGFLKMGIAAGSYTLNGRTMLFEQAEASWKIWNDLPA